MATTFTWYLQGTTPTEIEATDILQFANGEFDGPIFVSNYNDSTHVKTALDADKSSANTPRNNKFVSQAGGAGGDSEVSIDGGATQNLDTVVNGEAALHIYILDDDSVATTQTIFYSYDGTTPATPASGISVKAAEIGDANFTDAEGSGGALALTNQIAGTEYDFYIVISKTPTATGLKQDKLRFETVFA
jgi:hypothetical protein